ncbi:hypothetical protein Pelo_7877 [Pelomyxa schiedti]|nr:hypothetical protein Pelo_7877 [Pelomyxa schiedti]
MSAALPFGISKCFDARSQFIALGVGGIVGRCGAHSAVSSLGPACLSLIGRDWIVFPAKHVVIELMNDKLTMYVFVEFSVSPTMGVVDLPAVADLGSKSGHRLWKLCGWVGPKSAGTRFPLLSLIDGVGALTMGVFDKKGSWSGSNDSESVSGGNNVSMPNNVVAFMFQNETKYPVWAARGRWVVVVKRHSREGLGLKFDALTLWDFSGIESGLQKSTEIPVPWQVVKLQFLDDDSLVVLNEAGTGRAVVVIDLVAISERKELRVLSQFTLGPDEGLSGYHPVWCWGGKVYTTTIRNDHLVCVTTGERHELLKCTGELVPIGGPFFTLTEKLANAKQGKEVYSVMAPTKACFSHVPSHFCLMLFGNELAVKEEAGEIQVIDVESGLLMQITFGGVNDARSQFIALGVGGIVGRCGAHSAVSSLSQPLLSLIGRDWIVFPVRRSAIMLIDFGWTISLFVEFSVSPTMGLVDRPAVVDYGERITQFRGWVGPKSAGNRFPLMTSADNLQVIDRNWKPGSSWELVLNNTRSMRSTNVVVSVLSYGNLVAAKWRWVLNVKECRGGEHALELWDFGQIERGVVSNAEVSWQLKVMKMVFLGDDSLAVLHKGPTGRAVDVIDLAGTMLLRTA